ncbi:MAG: hypothetical protein ACI855_004728, partial [Myxococcota bacterium]
MAMLGARRTLTTGQATTLETAAHAFFGQPLGGPVGYA